MRQHTSKGFVLIETLLEMAVVLVLFTVGVEVYIDWMHREKARVAAREATEILDAVRHYYVFANEGMGGWPQKGEEVMECRARSCVDVPIVEKMIEDGHLPERLRMSPYDTPYILETINDGKMMQLSFETKNLHTAPYLALSIPGGKATVNVITAAMPRPFTHGSHSKLFRHDGSYALTGPLNMGGHAIKNAGDIRISQREEWIGTELDAGTGTDVAYFIDGVGYVAASVPGTVAIIGRYPSDSGRDWYVVNRSANPEDIHMIPLKTEAEWLSFKENLVPDHDYLEVCERIAEDIDDACTVEKTLTLTAKPTTVRKNGYSYLTWESTGYTSCQMKHFKEAWYDVDLSGSKKMRIKIGGTHQVECTASDGTSRNRSVLIKIKKAAHTHELPWEPSASKKCKGVEFTQTAQCGHTQSATGTKTTGSCKPKDEGGDKDCGSYSPRTSSICYGIEFTQKDDCGNSRNAYGTKKSGTAGGKDCSCYDPDVTKHNKTVNGYYKDILKREGDAGGLCRWSKEYPENASPENIEKFHSDFVWGARSWEGDSCGGWLGGNGSGDCYWGAKESKKHDHITDYNCSECMEWER